MKVGLAEIVLVLDRSGSMSSTKSGAEGGLREFIKKQRAVPGEAVVTFYRFDEQIDRVFEAKPIKEVNQSELALEPRGSTALLDAINRAIDEVGARLASKPEAERPEKVFVVIVTDGYENSSRTPRSTVFGKISTQRDSFKWEFVFIGANQDAIATAATLGIAGQSAISYAATGIGTQSVYTSLNANITRSRSTGDAFTWDDSDRQQQAAEQAKRRSIR